MMPGQTAPVCPRRPLHIFRYHALATWWCAVQIFLREALPEAPETVRVLAGDLFTTTLSAVGKDFSASPRTSVEIETYADAMADMFCAYLESLGDRG